MPQKRHLSGRHLDMPELLEMSADLLNYIDQFKAYKLGNKNIPLSMIDTSLASLLERMYKNEIVKDYHKALLHGAAYYAVRIDNIDPDRELKYSREQFIEAFQAMSNHAISEMYPRPAGYHGPDMRAFGAVTAFG